MNLINTMNTEYRRNGPQTDKLFKKAQNFFLHVSYSHHLMDVLWKNFSWFSLDEHTVNKKYQSFIFFFYFNMQNEADLFLRKQLIQCHTVESDFNLHKCRSFVCFHNSISFFKLKFAANVSNIILWQNIPLSIYGF